MTVRPGPLAVYTALCMYVGSVLTTWTLDRYGITPKNQEKP